MKAQKEFNEAKKNLKLQKQNLKALRRQMELANVRVDQAARAYNTVSDQIFPAKTARTLTRIFG